MTIRVDSRTLAAIDMIVGEIRAETGERVTQSSAIWEAINRGMPHIAKTVEELSQKREEREVRSRQKDDDRLEG